MKFDKLFISIGHGKKGNNYDTGAIYKNIKEHIIAGEIAFKIYKYLIEKIFEIKDEGERRQKNLIFLPFPLSLEEKVDFINKNASENSLAIEIHFDSAEKIIDDFHFLILTYDKNNLYNSDIKINFVSKLIDNLKKLRKWSSIQIIERKDLYFLKKTKCFSLILEIDYIWNYPILNADKVAFVISNVLFEFI